MNSRTSSTTAVGHAPKVPVCRRVAFVDGLARRGKFPICRILSHQNGGKHWQYQATIGQMCYMVQVDAIDEAVVILPSP